VAYRKPITDHREPFATEQKYRYDEITRNPLDFSHLDRESSMPMNDAAKPPTLVLGLGNPIVSDDSVGLRVAGQLKTLLAGRKDVEVSEDYWGGLRLMERMAGYARVIVIDAIVTGAPPGTVHRLRVDDISTQRSASAHDVNLPTALEFGRQAGLPLPANDGILLVGIEAADILTFSEQLTPAVEAAIPIVVQDILHILQQPS
jgi:hydrogenase maturation protease